MLNDWFTRDRVSDGTVAVLMASAGLLTTWRLYKQPSRLLAAAAAFVGLVIAALGVLDFHFVQATIADYHDYFPSAYHVGIGVYLLTAAGVIAAGSALTAALRQR